MKTLATIIALLGGLLVAVPGARAHCDAADGPVASAAVKALDMKNVNLVLPYLPAASEGELTAAFAQALVARTAGAEAKILADRYFMETAVRLHRAGENAPYTGLKPAGTDFGPAIPAAEEALRTGAADRLVALLSEELARSVAAHFEEALARQTAAKEPAVPAEVPAARERVGAELAFIGYVEAIYQAIHGAAAGEGERHAAATADTACPSATR
ncbi:MAG: DUF6448 family protein [Dongiaceae bacterium]